MRLEVELPVAERPFGDPDRLLQAVSALVANAIAYTPPGGEVRVSASVSEGRWRLRVDDSGPGIPAEKRAEVFGRFSRLDGAGASGTGLGLAICKRLVELMGGEVGVGESDSGAPDSRSTCRSRSGNSTQTQHEVNTATTCGDDTQDTGQVGRSGAASVTDTGTD